jgi:hypothetical protein
MLVLTCGLKCTTIFTMKTDDGKTETIQIRLTQQEKNGFLEAAELAGIPLSSWVRERLRLAAIRELEAADRPIPFIEPIRLGENLDE